MNFLESRASCVPSLHPPWLFWHLMVIVISLSTTNLSRCLQHLSALKMCHPALQQSFMQSQLFHDIL
ncbi:MAG: hypothetical protein ACLR0U_09795, partial [Enterocloster clostridioformis]